ncbi:MAG: hypothetical protein KGO02_02685, partial [Alphaproteobacteria bacterium]|nr:hypothetical protein [Alphaproteobacteria bacterium]
MQNNLNQLQHARIERKAVRSKRGRMRLSVASDADLSHLVETETSPSEPTVEVEVETIDHYVADHDLKVTAIKIDVE